MTTLITNPVAASIAAWNEASVPPVAKPVTVVAPPEPEPAQAVVPARASVATLTWVAAAVRVLPQDGSEMAISSILAGIRADGLRDLTGCKTPVQTLRRDLNAETRKAHPRVSTTRSGFYAKA
jgi:hypothetical protein